MRSPSAAPRRRTHPPLPVALPHPSPLSPPSERIFSKRCWKMETEDRPWRARLCGMRSSEDWRRSEEPGRWLEDGGRWRGGCEGIGVYPDQPDENGKTEMHQSGGRWRRQGKTSTRRTHSLCSENDHGDDPSHCLIECSEFQEDKLVSLGE